MILETERRRLREFVEKDWGAVLAYQSNPLYLRYYPWSQRTEADARDFVAMFLEWQQEEPRTRVQLAAVLRDEGRLIGNCGIRVDDAEWRQANIGFEFDSRFWNRGLATEAAGAMLDWGFRQFGLHRVWSWCVADNVGSARVLEKIGMRLEGRLRDKEFIKGSWRDQLLYAILEEEWRERNAKELEG